MEKVRRNRVRQHLTLVDRLTIRSHEERKQAASLQEGPERAHLLKLVRDCEAAIAFNGVLSAPSDPPKIRSEKA